MKICPTCRKTYQDDNLNFCLEDGSILTVASSEPAPTVMMSQPRPTDPSPGFGTPGTHPGIQSSFGNQGAYSQQPKRSSKTWLWALGIVGILVLLCGGGGVVGLLLIASQADVAANNSGPSATPSPGKGPFPGSSPSPNASPATSADVESIDLNMFVKEFSAYGTTEMSGEELLMAAKQKDYYYVLVAPDDYNTLGASTRVTLRNPDNGDSRLGYGLIFHSDPQPLTKGYAFLIDAKKKRYRVVRHTSSNESAIIPWKTSAAIRNGSADNTIEVRDKGDTLELYINDEMVTTMKDQYDGKVGVPGLYSGDGVKIAFKNLEIRK